MDEAAAHGDAAANQAGEALENAAEATGQAAENAGENVAEAADNAADATVNAADNAADATANAVDNAADATANAADNAADATANALDNAADTTATMADNATDAVTTDTAEVKEGTPVEGQIFQQDQDTFLASTILDATIINASGESVGDVNDLVVTADGKVSGVVIGVGGFLGVGEKNIALKMDRVDIQLDEDGDLQFAINESQEALENAPEFVTAAEQQSERDRTAATATTPTTVPAK